MQCAAVHPRICKVVKVQGISVFTSTEVQAKRALEYCISKVFKVIIAFCVWGFFFKFFKILNVN